MALQVWLPLNGNLQNQGVSGATFTSVGTWSYGVGKVTSQSMVSPNPSSSSATAYVYTTSTFKYTKNFSVSVWVKLPSANSSYSSYIATEGRADVTQYGWGLQGNATSLTARFGNGSNTKSSLTANTWHLATFTVDNSSKCSFYVDGVLNGSFTPSTLPTYAQDNGIGIGCFRYSSGNIYQWNGSINDFRLYNHCLSTKEIKNLSKGLMLHYTLSRGGANLLVNSNFTNGTTNWTAENSTMSVIDDTNFGKVLSFKASTANTGRVYNNVIGMFTNGNTYSYSFYAKASASVNIKPSRANADNGTTVTLTTVWTKYEGKITATATSNAFSFYSSNTTSTVYLANVKLELGNKSTPWIPNGADTLYSQMGLNNNIESDNSGYNNNGTRTNITAWNTDTARYLSSMTFNGSNSYIELARTLGALYNSDFSVSVWLRPSVAKRGIILSEYQATGASNVAFELSADLRLRIWWNSSPDIYTTDKLTVNEWNHVVFTKTSTKILFYINGSLSYTYNQSGGFSDRTSTAKPRIGDDYRSGTDVDYNGRMSDFRIYATALSADDVKELYNVSASLDKNGNVHCYELVES